MLQHFTRDQPLRLWRRAGLVGFCFFDFGLLLKNRGGNLNLGGADFLVGVIDLEIFFLFPMGIVIEWLGSFWVELREAFTLLLADPLIEGGIDAETDIESLPLKETEVLTETGELTDPLTDPLTEADVEVLTQDPNPLPQFVEAAKNTLLGANTR